MNDRGQSNGGGYFDKVNLFGSYLYELSYIWCLHSIHVVKGGD